MDLILSSIGDNVIKALSSTTLWIAVFKSVAIILLGFFLTRFKILGKDSPKVLSKIVLVLLFLL